MNSSKKNEMSKGNELQIRGQLRNPCFANILSRELYDETISISYRKAKLTRTMTTGTTCDVNRKMN